MNISTQEAEKLLKGRQTFSQVGFSMLLERMKKLYSQEPTEAMLQRVTDEINAFLSKFKAIMTTDYEHISDVLTNEKKCHVLAFEDVCTWIEDGKVLHIAGTEALLRKLPKGSWIGGSTEYFIAEQGGLISGGLLCVTEIDCEDFSIKTYDVGEIKNVGNDAFVNGFSIVIIPFDSEIHKVYSENAAGYEHIFMRNITGWIAGCNLDVPKQTPIAVNGALPEAYPDKAVALHLKIPEDKNVRVNIINVFSQDEASPVIEFTREGFSAVNCLVDGKETVFADYITQNDIDTKLPLVGDYSGNGVNISFKSVEDGTVNFYAPVFSGIKYRMAQRLPDYAAAFQVNIEKASGDNAVFSCNCILNFLYGRIEDEKVEKFNGPLTFGEIAYQLVNQTLVYVTVTD